ncbi:MAG: multiubiquitin domain-containing protein [Candidatus Thiodiazotropha sp. (ex Lucina aurantia)]|nr:multiubiquitin domain-containing protein [Candidatus Thiodiazotropha taylori]MBV2098751.1 multiubiquitin domain-containing protein [Candidatus Thiodiazotropha sp. (ex Codakia orbicularis)]MBV2103673.1 multiubiquitin domain-containing protein [Candidatus Thiodiazotropha sp. (ex Lucina aurantia)]MBV2118112.1 multiubiquitin domain-containing protein [Candidatus Thiodiazotropha sp. (ex Lucina aurantia)]
MNDQQSSSNQTHDNHSNDPGMVCRWVYTLDNDRYESDSSVITGRQILKRAGRVPVEEYLLVLSGHGRPREIALDEPIDLSERGVERLRALPRECREGLQGRRDFQLPADDQDFLKNLGLSWATVKEGGVMRLIIFSFPVPTGYNNNQVDLYLRIEATYPDTELDMVYVYPPLTLTNGKAIGALSQEAFDGRNWQRWSRHRTQSSKWRPGIDNIESHMALVSDWFAKEVSHVQ